MWLASRFEVCLSFTLCLFDVFRTEKALETVFRSFSPIFGCYLIPNVNVCECYIIVVVVSSISDRWVSLTCFCSWVFEMTGAPLLYEIGSPTFLCNCFWKPVFKAKCCLKVEPETCMFQRILLLESSIFCTFPDNF